MLKKKSRRKICKNVKDKIKASDKKRKFAARKLTEEKRFEIFESIKNQSMVDESILQTEAFNLIYSEYKEAISEGPTYICTVCWKFEFRRNILTLNSSKYESELFDECNTGKCEWICKTCDKYLIKGKLPPQAQANSLSLCPKVKELDVLCRLELMLISQIIPFMEIRPRARGIQCGIKGQCTLVPTDLKKSSENST